MATRSTAVRAVPLCLWLALGVATLTLPQVRLHLHLHLFAYASHLPLLITGIVALLS